MKQQSRRGLLKSAAKAAVIVGGAAAAMDVPVSAQSSSKPEKRAPLAKAQAAGAEAPLFNSAISFGNLLFLAGVGAHFEGTVQEHTKHVLDELEANLKAAGSSMDKVLKVNVYLSDIKDWASMNEAYKGRFGSMPPVRTTVAPGGIPGNSLVEIDLIAYL